MQEKVRDRKETAIVLAADTLLKIMKPGNEEHMLPILMDLTKNSAVVLACRVSPIQKADIVRMVRKQFPEKSTLAIGDGANDVNMITAAHVGVGISGLEGAQASRAADYSIGQFKFLKNLMFTHGREAYRKNTFLISYMFYKNWLYVLPLWMYGFMSQFSGTMFYDNLLYQCYNVVFTSWPIIIYAVFDWEYTKEFYMEKAEAYHYKLGLKNYLFNARYFWRWFIYAVI
eukprot:CAMPEP_0176360878 /NCGR_PEP_ID=MMETSP0126-20121128/17362_1 /TAXON_ID=141414 ORGANISM="Strombidinopsis acuminatum, Strain SPMC142" /NCGR_SAMPLE_ID=MMETSP0126 /ASSEMBLY_ACC=CAM_ASM_000229 /LENGTH=228 /DNA_ID=CAMNT_0017716223 /DNA_START=136 /DNA_END=822 /DNA_ORIENTATION=+